MYSSRLFIYLTHSVIEKNDSFNPDELVVSFCHEDYNFFVRNK